jgi:DNA polymerase-3 subunit alpha
MKNWTNLHNHTVFSMLDGHGDIEEYLTRAKSLGMKGLATTDHGNIHSWLDFYDAGTSIGVKPILGSEFYQARKSRFDRDEEERSGPSKNEWEQRGPYHITILAKNKIGYKNIIKMSSRSFLEGYYVKPRIDHDLISEHAEGIIVLSGCLNSEICQALLRDDYNFALAAAKKMQDIVGKENYFIEVQDHGLGEQRKVFNQLVQIAETIGAKVVPSGDCHYVHKCDARAHDIMLCVATNANIHTPNRFSFSGEEFYLQSYDEMSSKFNPDWLKNSMDVCDMVDLNLTFGDIHFPDFPIPTLETSVEYFDRLAWTGLRERYGDPLPQHIIDRANHEIRVVKEMGFTEYFLVVSDLVNWAKNNNVRVGWGRGSAAGSILSYAFKITNLDPIKFGLMFERFLVEGRKSMPDIDLDFDDRYRDEVINYARTKYGSDHVAHICTFNRTGARQSIRDAARALGYDFSAGDAVAKLVPPPVLGVSKNLSECMEVQDFKQLYEKDTDAKSIVDAAFGLEGLVRQTGMHAAGIVISRDALTEYLPIMQKGANSPMVTQWDMGRVEQCGLLKIDFLGLRNLGIIDSCVKLIKKHHDIDIDIDQIPLDDHNTYEQLCRGNCIGVFQLESSGMRQLMMQLQPKNIEDIMALISLYRPGPMGSGMDREYIDRKHGRSKVKYEHPKLEKVLGPSLGIMLYQEDVLGVARELAGFTSAEADDLRKVIGKKLMDKIANMRSKFVQDCIKNSGISDTLANKIFSDIEYFGGYGFNRAHAASYAMISYITAYLKTNYTVEYMAALMSSVVGNKDKQSLYLADCRKLGVNVMPPSINYSGIDFEVLDSNSIIFGLSAINGIGNSIAENIVSIRDQSKPYTNMHDFFRRCGATLLKKSTLEHLAKAGALDELFNIEDNELNRIQEIKLLEIEKEELGIYVTDHPVNGIWDILSKKIDYEIFDLSELSNNTQVKIGGILSDVKPMVTKKGMKMYKLILEDISSDIEIIVFPKSLKNLGETPFSKGDILIVNGSVNKEGDEENSIVKLYYNSSEKVDSKIFSSGKAIILEIDENFSPSLIEKIYGIIESTKGDKPVFMQMTNGNHKYIFKFKNNTSSKVQSVIENIIRMEKENV